MAVVARQQRGDVFRATHAEEELVDAQAVGAVEPGAGLGHQAEVRCAGGIVGREVVVRRGRTVVAQVFVPDFDEVLLDVGTDLIRRDAGAVFIGQGPDGNVTQTVTGGADLGVNLEAALQLVLVEGAEGTVEGETDVLHVTATFARGQRRGACQSNGGQCGECKFPEHAIQSFSFTRPGSRRCRRWTRTCRSAL